MSTSFLTSKPTPPAQAMSSSRAGSSFRQRRNFVSLVDVHSQKQKERASQELPFAENNGEISWMAYRCNNLPLRQRTFGKKPPLYLSDVLVLYWSPKRDPSSENYPHDLEFSSVDVRFIPCVWGLKDRKYGSCQLPGSIALLQLPHLPTSPQCPVCRATSRPQNPKPSMKPVSHCPSLVGIGHLSLKRSRPLFYALVELVDALCKHRLDIFCLTTSTLEELYLWA